ncbi:MAG: regulatory protein RecX [Clostridia bacterium]|nr:regulatory protein RecX [Clostridia bacterium]
MEAKEKALRLLEFRSHSEKELHDKLIRAGAKAEDLPEIFEFLREYSFVNDAEYAKKLAKDLQHLNKFGLRRIREELKVRGIFGDDLENAMLELSDEEEEQLLPLMERKLSGNFDKKNIDRAIRYFAYRGYGFDDIKSAIERIKGGALED